MKHMKGGKNMHPKTVKPNKKHSGLNVRKGANKVPHFKSLKRNKGV